jgi:Leucine-rich repeat (LRR) protein
LAQIIEDNIPEVEAIDLSDNRLNTLDQMSSLFAKAKNLKILYLANNRVSLSVYPKPSLSGENILPIYHLLKMFHGDGAAVGGQNCIVD